MKEEKLYTKSKILEIIEKVRDRFDEEVEQFSEVKGKELFVKELKSTLKGSRGNKDSFYIPVFGDKYHKISDCGSTGGGGRWVKREFVVSSAREPCKKCLPLQNKIREKFVNDEP